VSLNPAHGEVYSKQLYVIKLFSDLCQVCDFPPHDIAKISFKATLNIITTHPNPN
jgi:hypothetical protein